MSDENKAGEKWMDKLRHHYRMVIMNDETFEEVSSYKLSLLNVYIMISSVVVLVALLIIGLIVFTPLKRYIPGYGDDRVHSELMEMNEGLQAMEEQLAAQKAYTDNFRRILVGNVETEAEVGEEAIASPDSLQSVARIEEDELLREETKLTEQIQARELSELDGSYRSREIPLEQLYFVPPVSGIISAVFEPEIRHFGTDVLAPKNTPVKSAMDGFVFFSDWTVETGLTIGVQHANDVITFYKHNSALLKKMGDYVKAGEALAIIGNSGMESDGPHLHFELWHRGQPVDPMLYLNFE
ncbi:MAG: M23 family metallopeptidase [Bacteroidota bacterium]